MSIDSIKSQNVSVEQKNALNKLHETAQQMESLFVNMLFKEMRKSESHVSLTGKNSQAEETFKDMLDEKRSVTLAQNGSFGIAQIIEQQMRATVLAEAKPLKPIK